MDRASVIARSRSVCRTALSGPGNGHGIAFCAQCDPRVGARHLLQWPVHGRIRRPVDRGEAGAYCWSSAASPVPPWLIVNGKSFSRSHRAFFVSGADVLTAGLKAAVSGMGLAIEAAEYLIA